VKILFIVCLPGKTFEFSLLHDWKSSLCSASHKISSPDLIWPKHTFDPEYIRAQPGYFLTWPYDIFLIPREKEKCGILRKFSRPRGCRPYLTQIKNWYLDFKKLREWKIREKIGIFRENVPNPEVVDPTPPKQQNFNNL